MIINRICLKNIIHYIDRAQSTQIYHPPSELSAQPNVVTYLKINMHLALPKYAHRPPPVERPLASYLTAC